ncbi:MAG: hypothetical protein JO316_10615 [Abitibacteriaceae bacterium]|nr:hypothetical protein [Abditibacteriaceae bacterium]
MTIDGIFCNGRYRVSTVSSEMRMSHWIDAPIVTRVEDGSSILDLSQEIWDLQDTREEGEVLVLIIRKYPGLTNGVEVSILPELGSFLIADSNARRNVTREELMAKLSEYP